jgi:hypothetical protein
MSYLYAKGTIQRDFVSQVFSRMASSQAPYWVSEGFLNFAANSRKYS